MLSEVDDLLGGFFSAVNDIGALGLENASFDGRVRRS